MLFKDQWLGFPSSDWVYCSAQVLSPQFVLHPRQCYSSVLNGQLWFFSVVQKVLTLILPCNASLALRLQGLLDYGGLLDFVCRYNDFQQLGRHCSCIASSYALGPILHSFCFYVDWEVFSDLAALFVRDLAPTADAFQQCFCHECLMSWFQCRFLCHYPKLLEAWDRLRNLCQFFIPFAAFSGAPISEFISQGCRTYLRSSFH